MQIETTGKLHALTRKIGKIGGEIITFSVTIHDLEQWNRLIGFSEQAVTITLGAAQGELPLDGGDDDGEGGDGDEDPERSQPRRRTRKVPTDGRADDDERPHA